MKKLSLEELISRVDEIPVFSQTVNRIIQITEDPESSAKDLESEIMKDQGLTTKILRLANSSYYGVSRNIKSVSEATVLLGFQAIKSMVFASTVGKVMEKELPGYALEREALWRQSQMCAITARAIAKKVKFPKPDQAYTAGLLRDIGKVILDTYMNDQFEQIIKEVELHNKPFLEVETEVLGYNHSEVGARIAEKWNLPQDLIESIACHHNPEKAIVNPKMTAMIHIADGLMMMMGYNIGIDGLNYNFSDDAMTLLGIDESVLTEIMSEVADFIGDEGMFF
ncbi:HDOD domain-containing protein [Petrocella sp. FN5]|uniref:HDOD domain-containing protein n=1 Tax=Petrocella sp. FN5 TaxID=3032002 RepID=UPI0023DA6414|nr:HDOD domain-containing protein [Petrocella sp. FN5]MDF1617736.1 HDOD domain-containing protein [Petrocella sp. FN5]